MPDYGDIHALSANASPEFHAMIEKACKQIGCDKATFIRLACRIAIECTTYGEEELPLNLLIFDHLPFSRSAYDVHKDLANVKRLMTRIRIIKGE